IDVAEAAADARRGAGQLVLVEAPARLVHLVDALVAEVAVAVVPEPVPVVVDGAVFRGVAVRHLEGGGAAPEVVVHRGGRLLRAVHLADRRAELVAEPAGQLHRADLAGVDEGDRLAHALHAAALGAGLADAVVGARRLDDAPALGDVVADRLLDVDVLAV